MEYEGKDPRKRKYEEGYEEEEEEEGEGEEEDPYVSAEQYVYSLHMESSDIEDLVETRNHYEEKLGSILKSKYSTEREITFYNHVIKLINNEIDKRLRNRGKRESVKERESEKD